MSEQATGRAAARLTAGEHHERLVPHVRVRQRRNHLANQPVQIRHQGVVGPARCPVDEGKLVQRRLRHLARAVRRMRRPEEKEPLVRRRGGVRAHDRLGAREEEIVALVAAGASNKMAAGKLFVSENTIKFHLKNIYSKLGASSRIQAVQIARDMHLIQ